MDKNQAIAQVLTAALDVAKKTGDWLANQLPDVLHQLIAWNIAKDTLLLIFAIVFVAFYGWSMRELFKSETWRDPDNGLLPVWGIFGGIFTLGSIISLMVNALDLVELLVAPKVWLLEYAAHLVH